MPSSLSADDYINSILQNAFRPTRWNHHTPQDEILRLYNGDALDIVGEQVQTDFRRPTTKQLEEDFEITLRNPKDEVVEVRVVEHLFRLSEWKMLQASTDFTELDSSTIEFRVRSPANGERTVS